MNKLQGNEIQKAKFLFEKYNSNQSVIFSVFDNQFDGCVYVDNVKNIRWAVLQTPFLQHFIAGNPTIGCETTVESILFDSILPQQCEKEIVVFSDSDEWNDVLHEVFKRHNGVSDSRKIFDFSLENYGRIIRPNLPNEIQSVLEKCKNLPFSHTDTWSVKLLFDGKCVSYCNAIMVGKNKAEIDIFTEEEFRGKGYATLAALFLIDKLLENGLIPTWSTWPYRVESQHIAKKLGFVCMPDAKAWIWQEGM